MVVAEWLARAPATLAIWTLAQRWAKGVAILFAVGAVSGTVLSFELGLLWPRFMQYAGAIIGMPFSLEGFAFFTEAIFLGVYLYGWDRIPRGRASCAGVIVAAQRRSVGGVRGDGERLDERAHRRRRSSTATDRRTSTRSPAMRSPAALAQVLHMLLAAYAATGLAVAGIHALMLLRGSAEPVSPRALAVALLVGAPAAILQPSAGDYEARVVGAARSRSSSRRWRDSSRPSAARRCASAGGPTWPPAGPVTPSRSPGCSRCWRTMIPTPRSRGLDRVPARATGRRSLPCTWPSS